MHCKEMFKLFFTIEVSVVFLFATLCECLAEIQNFPQPLMLSAISPMTFISVHMPTLHRAKYILHPHAVCRYGHQLGYTLPKGQ